MPKFTLIAEWDENTTTQQTFNVEHLDDVVMNMDQFLRGCGFFYDGELTICEDTINYGDPIKFDWGSDHTMNCSSPFTSDTITITTGNV